MELWTAFALGLFGSLHCAGMCGPLALALPASGTFRSSYLAGRLAYNLGRLMTYGVLGVIFGLVGRTLALAGFQRWVSLGLGLAVLLGWLVSLRLPLSQPPIRLVAQLKAALASLLHRRTVASLWLLGGLNGLLPCGLVYVACAGATATGDLLAGARYMFAFGVGTVPMMLALGLSGRFVQGVLGRQYRRVVPVCLVTLSALLILRGLALGIPYLSPDLSAAKGGAACCHTGADSPPPPPVVGAQKAPPPTPDAGK